MAMWDGTFDDYHKKNELDNLLERELKRIDEYEKQFANSGTLAFWLDPDRWEGTGSTNLRDPGCVPFWMREKAPKPVAKPANHSLRIADGCIRDDFIAGEIELPEPPARPVPPALQQIEGKWPCGCPAYKGRQIVRIKSNGQYDGEWTTCSNCGAGWKRNSFTGEDKLVYRLRQRFHLDKLSEL